MARRQGLERFSTLFWILFASVVIAVLVFVGVCRLASSILQEWRA